MMRMINRMLAAAALGLLFVSAQPSFADQPEQAPGVEVQTRGPVHEAYATPVEATPHPGPMISRQPPDPIEEQPPDQKPDGNVQWMPGYWAWDDGRNDFLWVSGFWRTMPPGRTWIPGAWHNTADGWQWTPGFWNSAEQKQIEYLPPPPATVEAGPTVPAPSADYVYIPGSWYYSSYRYVWRPGVWVAHRPGWVWIPAHFRWTPVGYVFVDGYWDFELRERGILFSPVWIDVRFAYRPGWYYRPTYIVYSDSLYGAMFVYSGRYCFGDYFEARYTQLGYRSWFSVSFGVGFHYDPLFTYYSVQYRRDPFWAPGIREVYAARYAGDLARPPVTIVNNTTVVNNVTNTTIINKYPNINRSTNVTNITNVNNTVVNINKVNNTNVTNNNTTNTFRALPKMTQVTPAQKQQYVLAAKEVHTAAAQRLQQENALKSQGTLPKVGEAPKAAAVTTSKTMHTASTAAMNANAIKQPPPPAVKPHTSSTATTGTGAATGTGTAGSGSSSKPPLTGSSNVPKLPVNPTNTPPKAGEKTKTGEKPKTDEKPKTGDLPKGSGLSGFTPAGATHGNTGNLPPGAHNAFNPNSPSGSQHNTTGVPPRPGTGQPPSGNSHSNDNKEKKNNNDR